MLTLKPKFSTDNNSTVYSVTNKTNKIVQSDYLINLILSKSTLKNAGVL
jgi:hypothetical protein